MKVDTVVIVDAGYLYAKQVCERINGDVVIDFDNHHDISDVSPDDYEIYPLDDFIDMWNKNDISLNDNFIAFVTTDIEYPFNEGDDYWTIESYTNREGDVQILAVQSCWDEESKVMYHEDKEKLYFNSLEKVFNYCRDRYSFIKLSFFHAEYPDIKDGDCFIADEETGKFAKI